MDFIEFYTDIHFIQIIYYNSFQSLRYYIMVLFNLKLLTSMIQCKVLYEITQVLTIGLYDYM